MKLNKKLSLVACLIACAALLISCNLGGSKIYLKDYYVECGIRLPFEYKKTYEGGNACYFTSELTIEQMCEELNNAGYTASIHEGGGLKRIFIVAGENGFAYYFVIYDKGYLTIVDRYTLRECSACIFAQLIQILEHGTATMYVFLYPSHFSDNSLSMYIWEERIYCTFDEFAAFYTSTGKDDAQVDYVNKTVTFFCEGNPNYSWIRGSIILQYIESADGNYISIQPVG